MESVYITQDALKSLVSYTWDASVPLLEALVVEYCRLIPESGCVVKLVVSPLLRVKKDETESVGILHLGRQLCGHDGIVHGGMIAVAFDEFLGRPVCLVLSPLSPELR